jgi:aldose 1-epimerase
VASSHLWFSVAPNIGLGRLWGAALVLSAIVGCSSPPKPAADAQSSEANTTPSSLAPESSLPGAAAGVTSKAPALTHTVWGSAEGKDVELYTLTNAHGLVLKVTTYGATITELHVPDRDGRLSDIVLGFESLEGYLKGTPYFGSIAGRVANRIRNAKFTLDGKEYKLAANDPPHHLHGGTKGFDKLVWNAKPGSSSDGPSVELSLVSKDGDEGYPGTVTVKVTYTLTEDDTLRTQMVATTDKTTLVNLAQHSYFNLEGHGAGSVVDHELTLMADQYTPGDPMVPTGALKPVKGTPFDFTQPKPIGKDLQAVGGTPVGFDANWVVNGDPNTLRPVARVRSVKSGRVMTLDADQPGVQFYSGNFLDGSLTGKGARYPQHSGFCLETQKFPNAINVPAWAKQVVLEPGKTYEHTMVHRFSTE